jgi:hypothetical protein
LVVEHGIDEVVVDNGSADGAEQDLGREIANSGGAFKFVACLKIEANTNVRPRVRARSAGLRAGCYGTVVPPLDFDDVAIRELDWPWAAEQRHQNADPVVRRLVFA